MENTEGEPYPFHMARNMFKSCMDKEQIEALGTSPLKMILKDLGGWPVLEGRKWQGKDYIWYEQVYKFRSMGYSVDYFYDFSVTTDLKNSSWRILDLDQPGLGMSREYLIKGLKDEDVKVSLHLFFCYLLSPLVTRKTKLARKLRCAQKYKCITLQPSVP